ncbi:MAG: histidinol-phosphate transaminase [Actinomycetales bacterium]
MTSLDDLPLRDDLRGLQPYGAPQLDVPVRLNTNESSYPLPQPAVQAVVAAVAECAPSLNRYPDREFSALRADLAGYLTEQTGCQVIPEQVWAGNGSNEVLQQLVQAFAGPGRTALGFTPAYSMHPLISRGSGSTWVDGRREADFDLDAEHIAAQIQAVRPDVVFLCSPNNPTGTALRLDVVEAAYEAGAGLLVVDEAYAEFARPGTPSAISLLPGRPRLVVTRTMSKAFALAGARLGYLAADPAVCDALRLVRLPYHLSAPTQAVARAALAHHADLLSTVDALKAQRDRIVQALPGLGLHPLPSDANFVMFGGLDDEKATWQRLLDAGVLVRDVGIAGHLRVTAGTPEETTAFLDALRAVVGSPDSSEAEPAPESTHPPFPATVEARR